MVLYFVHFLSLLQVCLFNASDANSATVNALPCDWRFFVEHIPNAKRMLPLKLRLLFNTLEYARERMAIVLDQVQAIIMQMCTDSSKEVGCACHVHRPALGTCVHACLPGVTSSVPQRDTIPCQHHDACPCERSVGWPIFAGDRSKRYETRKSLLSVGRDV